MRSPRGAAIGVVGLAFVGLWLGHTAEFLRLEGMAALGAALTGPVHGYMLGAGALLALGAMAVAVRILTAWRRLEHALTLAEGELRRVLRGRRVPPLITGDTSPLVRGSSLTAVLAGLQTGLYVLQENIEAARAQEPLPGLGTITGAHWAAPILQFAVAAGLAAIVVLVAGRRSGAERRLRRIARLITALLCKRRTVLPPPAVPAAVLRILLVSVHALRGPPQPAAL